VDHATGDIEGHEEARGLKSPASARRLKWGSFPSSIHFRASFGSRPSYPTMITRSVSVFASFPLPRRTLKSIRIGQMRMVTNARRKVTKRTKKEERNAKPAPGPM
jgi:hypothetical protein